MATGGDVPESLLAARRTLDEFGEVRIVQDWHRGEEGWRLRVDLTPGDLGTKFPIPPTTSWYVLAEPNYPAGLIGIWPAADGGITETFWHQIPNTPPLPGRPYRGGKLCVATDSENNLRSNKEVEPRSAEDRLAWHVRRAGGWLQQASHGTLVVDGEWFELPFYHRSAGRLVAFREGPKTLAQWAQTRITSGLAEVLKLPTGHDVVASFRSLGREELVRPSWGQAIVGRRQPSAMWVRFPEVVALAPYQAPRTWGELRTVARGQSVDLDRLVRDGTHRFHDHDTHLMLVGFPVPEKVGEPARQMHWQAIELPRLERRPMSGSPRTAEGWWQTSRTGTLADREALNWAPSENWHPDQLATRGRLDRDLTEQRVVLIGAGALGSPIGELLVRAGVTDITVVDPERLVAGNLVRHTLTMNDLGSFKAESLAGRLSALSPNVRASAVNAAFPIQDGADQYRAADLVIDTTGEYAVLKAIAAFPWDGEPTYASFSVSMHAKRLFAFVAKGSGFSVANFDLAYQSFGQEEFDRDEERPWEGIGCFHPVFPARADEIWLMASAAVSLMDDQWPIASGSCEFHVFERDEDGTGRFTGLRKIAL